MIDKLVRKLNQFYHFSFLLIMVGTLGTIFYFWKSGFIDGSRNKELHKANYILEQIKSEKPLRDIRSAVYSENSKRAIEKLESLESDLVKLHKLVGSEKFIDLKKESGDLKTSIANLISFSKTTKILSVFNNKLSKFNAFVQQNNWRTLTRTSNRVLNLTKGHINKNKLRSLVSTIEKDFTYMVKVTERSILTSPEKSEILSRISNLEIETNMLRKYIGEREFFYGAIKNFSKNMNKWIGVISPDLSYQRLQVEQMGRYYIIALFGILALVSGLFFSSFVFQKWYRKNAQVELEDFLESFVSEGLVKNEKQNLSSFSTSFQHFSVDIANYIEKRMSYGAIFQKALPLSGIMLDKNLKVTWANKQFCDDWSLSEEEISKNYLSWDYLSKLTNLGDNDPVLEALKHKVAGIYQVQVKVDEKSDVAPYEMFVSPVDYKDETRIMVFFYSLAHLHETIKDQAHTINNPIEKTLRLIASNEFTETSKEVLQYEYDIAGISPLLSKFDEIVSIFKSEKNRLVDQIEMLYQKVDTLESLMATASTSNLKISEFAKFSVKNLKAFKDGVVSVTSLGKQSEELAVKELVTLNKSLNSFESSFKKARSMKSLVDQLSDSMPKFISIKKEIKEHKNLLSDTKMRLSHSLSHMVHLKKMIENPQALERFNTSYERVGVEFKNLDTVSSELDKKLTSLEVILSKGQMVIDDVNRSLVELDTKREGEDLVSVQEDLRIYQDQISGISGFIESKEDGIVEELKSIYMNTKNILEANKEVSVTLNLDIVEKLHQFGTETTDDSSNYLS